MTKELYCKLYNGIKPIEINKIVINGKEIRVYFERETEGTNIISEHYCEETKMYYEIENTFEVMDDCIEYFHDKGYHLVVHKLKSKIRPYVCGVYKFRESKAYKYDKSIFRHYTQVHKTRCSSKAEALFTACEWPKDSE